MNDRNGWCDKGTKTSTKTAVLKLDMLMWDRKGISLSRKVVLLYYLGPSMAVASEGLKVMPLGNFWFCQCDSVVTNLKLRGLCPRGDASKIYEAFLFKSWDSVTFDEKNWMLTATAWLVPGPDTGGYRHCLSEWCLWAVLTGRACLIVFFPLRVCSGPPQSWMKHMRLLSTSCQASQKRNGQGFIDVYYVETIFSGLPKKGSNDQIQFHPLILLPWVHLKLEHITIMEIVFPDK